MTIPIVKLPTSSLRKPSSTLDVNLITTKEVQDLIAEMIPTMYQADGIGIAAPQVGKNIRLCIIGKLAFKGQKTKKGAEKIEHKDTALINPSWIKLSKKTANDVEGCLSVPGKQGKVKRYKDILVTAYNDKAEKIVFEAHGYLARVVQHEVDHLDGVLFIDRAIEVYNVKINTENN